MGRWFTTVLIGFGLSPVVVAGDDSAHTPLFTEQSNATGLVFRYQNGADGHLYFAEMMGAGGALIDYDRDGDLDVFLVQGGLPGKKLAGLKGGDRLFRNDGIDPISGKLHFTDVTVASGLARESDYGMGAAVADINNDGWPDLYVTNFGSNRLWLNRHGKFVDITRRSGTGEHRWSVSASFSDLNGDGLPDLYVGNYVDYSIARHKVCRTVAGKPDYCSPKSYNPNPDRLFRNLGHGKFQDISVNSGIEKAYGGALGVVSADFNGDGRRDIYVANDGVPNQMWINHGKFQFENEALLSGVAVNARGMAEASMGVDAADFDNDGDIDLFMTHLTRETNTLYVNDGTGWFEDRTAKMLLATSSIPFTSFGTLWFDADSDGDLDLYIANGAVTQVNNQVNAGDPYPLKQSNQFLRNTGNGKYVDDSLAALDHIEPMDVSRGLLAGDLDNDGDLDLVVCNNGGLTRLLINQSNPSRWIGISPKINKKRAVQTGARVTLLLPGQTRSLQTRRDGSYASSRDPRVIFALPVKGKNLAHKVSIAIRWSDGSGEVWQNLTLNRYHELLKGTGVPVGKNLNNFQNPRK